MTINISRQDGITSTQKYFFPIGEDKWEINYNVFSYPSELDKPRNAVDESLTIQRVYPDKFGKFDSSTGSFWEGIYLKNGKISFRFFEQSLPFSPVLDGFNELESSVQEEVLNTFSSEAKSLLERGLNKYTEKKSD